MWILHRQQQQRGAQLHARPGSFGALAHRPGEVPSEAVADREAQDHEQAGGLTQPGEAPASELPNRDQDNTPSAPDPSVEWDDVVQPERQRRGGDADDYVPEGK